MIFTKSLCLLVLIILSFTCLVENRSYNNGLIFYNLVTQQIYLPPTISVSRGRSLAKFKYSPRGSIWSTFGKPCDCTGPLCGCCVGMKVKQYNFDQKICANVSYAPVKDEIQLEVLLNDTSTAKYGIAARNPSPLCIPIMMGIPMSMCVQMSNVGLMGDSLNMCMDFMVRLASSDLFEMHFQCMKLGLQGANWVGPDGQPVIPSNEGKIKDKSNDESEEYYDESVAVSAENEIISQEKQDKVSNENIMEEESNKEEDVNKAAEEIDYNDITEKVIETANNNEEMMALNSDFIKDIEIDGEPIQSEQVLENSEEKISAEESKTTEKMIETNEKPLSEKVKESALNQMKQSVMQAVDKESMKEEKSTEKPLQIEFQNLSEALQTSQEQGDNMVFSKDEINFEIQLQKKPEKDTNENLALSPNATEDKEIMPMAMEQNYNKQASQTVDKFEMLISNNAEETTEISETSQEILQQQPLLTNTEPSITNDMKPTFAAAAVSVTETTSKTGIDNIDKALATALITAETTTKTTMKTTEENSVVFEYNRHDNDDNSHEYDSDYDNEESDELEDETTEKLIETNVVTTIKNIVMPIATNDLNNEKIIATTVTTAIKDNDNNLANTFNSNESISNNDNEHDEDEDENDSKDEQIDSEEDDDDDDETSTESVNDSLTPSLLNKTNKTQMTSLDSNINSLALPENTKTTTSQMPQNSFLTTAKTTTTTAGSTTSTTTEMPLPLARKLFALHQHQQQQLQKHQQNHHHHHHQHRRLQQRYHI